MFTISLRDNKCLEDTINGLLTSTEELTEIERELDGDEGYREILGMMDTIRDMMDEMPEFGLLEEYRDAVENKTGYEVNAAYLRGIKTGFNLAMYVIGGSRQQDMPGKGDPDGNGQMETAG